MNRKSKIEKMLRDELAKTSESRYSIARKTGVSAPILCRFMQGTRGLSVESAEALLEFFHYTLPCKRAKA